MIDRYLIHSHRYQNSEPATAFWTIHSTVVQLCIIWKLNMIVAFVQPNNDGCAITKFMSPLKTSGWVLSTTKCLFPDFGNSITGTTPVIVGVHGSTQSHVERMLFQILLLSRPLPLAALFGNHSTPKNTVSVSRLQWRTNRLAPMPIMASMPPYHQLWAYNPFQPDSSHCIICILKIWIQHQLLAQQFSRWTASACLLLNCLTLTCFAANLVWNSTQRAILTSNHFCRSNLPLALD